MVQAGDGDGDADDGISNPQSRVALFIPNAFIICVAGAPFKDGSIAVLNITGSSCRCLYTSSCVAPKWRLAFSKKAETTPQRCL